MNLRRNFCLLGVILGRAVDPDCVRTQRYAFVIAVEINFMLLSEKNKRKSKSSSGCLGNGGHFLISTHQPGKITQLETRLMQLRYIQER